MHPRLSEESQTDRVRPIHERYKEVARESRIRIKEITTRDRRIGFRCYDTKTSEKKK